jgi:hypothetical protein
MWYVMVQDYVNELVDHWLVKNKWNLHGQRRAKDLKLRIKGDEKETDPVKKEYSLWAATCNFLFRGVTESDGHTYITRKPSVSLRGMLMSYLAPTLAPTVFSDARSIESQDLIQKNIKAHLELQGAPLLQRKIDFTRFLNRYILKRTHEWTKMHGISRAYELTEVINQCKTQTELDNALVKFMCTGEVAASDYSFWNINKPSGTHASSLRGELATFLLMNEEERKIVLVGSPATYAAKAPAVAPVAVAAPAVKDNTVRDQFLRDLPNLSATDIATKLGLGHFDEDTFALDEDNRASWNCFCLPNIFRR